MSSPLCRRLGINESPQFGDIGAIRRRWGIEHHGFVYLNEDLVYTKTIPQSIATINLWALRVCTYF